MRLDGRMSATRALLAWLPAALAPACAWAAPPDPVEAVGVQGIRPKVADDNHLHLRLADGTVVRVLAGSDVEIRRLRQRAPGRRLDPVLDLRRGKTQTDVVPGPAVRLFELRAPGVVASVRG